MFQNFFPQHVTFQDSLLSDPATLLALRRFRYRLAVRVACYRDGQLAHRSAKSFHLLFPATQPAQGSGSVTPGVLVMASSFNCGAPGDLLML
jgi:hypothetical protein